MCFSLVFLAEKENIPLNSSSSSLSIIVTAILMALTCAALVGLFVHKWRKVSLSNPTALGSVPEVSRDVCTNSPSNLIPMSPLRYPPHHATANNPDSFYSEAGSIAPTSGRALEKEDQYAKLLQGNGISYSQDIGQHSIDQLQTLATTMLTLTAHSSEDRWPSYNS